MNLSLPRPRMPVVLLAALLAGGWGLRAAEAPAPTLPTRADYASFSVIAERNIFNAGRSGRRSSGPRETRRPSRVDSFGLVGVLRSEKGTFAFFDGSGSEYRKALAPGGTLAGFKLIDIQPGAVALEAGTNRTELRIGMQFRREEAGEWRLSERTETFASSGSGSSSASSRGADSSPTAGGDAAAASGGGDADEVLKRLLQKREQESK